MSNDINDWNYVNTHLNDFAPSEVIYHHLNKEQFDENFIVKNLTYFSQESTDLIRIVKFKKALSDDFFKKICSKDNYMQIKCARKLKEPLRDFRQLDDLFY
jgi:hypothetical protein